MSVYTYEELEDAFEEDLNDLYGEIEVCGMEYDAGYTLRSIDPIAFRQELLNWIDNRGYMEMSIDNRIVYEDDCYD